MAEANERDPRLAALDVFVGEWIEQVEVPGAPPGRSIFEWDLKGSFLVQRALSPLPEYPDGLMIISVEPDGYLQHYFDSRGSRTAVPDDAGERHLDTASYRAGLHAAGVLAAVRRRHLARRPADRGT